MKIRTLLPPIVNDYRDTPIKQPAQPAENRAGLRNMVTISTVKAPPPKGGGFELRLKAGLVRLWRTQVEVIIWFGWRLVLDILGPHLIGNIATAWNPVTSRPAAIPRR